MNALVSQAKCLVLRSLSRALGRLRLYHNLSFAALRFALGVIRSLRALGLLEAKPGSMQKCIISICASRHRSKASPPSLRSSFPPDSLGTACSMNTYSVLRITYHEFVLGIRMRFRTRISYVRRIEYQLCVRRIAYVRLHPSFAYVGLHTMSYVG